LLLYTKNQSFSIWITLIINRLFYMLKTLENIFLSSQIETPDKHFVKIHSNTSKEQGLFLQRIFDEIKPKKTLEVGLAYGISTLFILEKHREYLSIPKSHIVIEPFPWDGVAEYNIQKESLSAFVDIKYLKSDEVLPRLFYENQHIQYAYIDTTKNFDTVLHDFYFIDKILDLNGVVIFDDCGGTWPGVQRVVRFVNTLPHYKIYAMHNKQKIALKKNTMKKIISIILGFLPFKKVLYPTICFKSDSELGLDYACIAFQKHSHDKREWNWDSAF